MARVCETFQCRNRYQSLMRRYAGILKKEGVVQDKNPEFPLKTHDILFPLSDLDDEKFYRLVNVAGISVNKGKIAGLDGVFIGPDGVYSKNPLSCPSQKTLSYFGVTNQQEMPGYLG